MVHAICPLMGRRVRDRTGLESSSFYGYLYTNVSEHAGVDPLKAVRLENEDAGMGLAIESREEPMKQYLLSVYQPDGEPPPAPVLEKIMKDVHALRAEMKAAGAWVFAGGLHDASTATVVRVQNGQVLMTDGPFTEGKEHIGGFSVIKAGDLDTALEWGRKLARATTLPIEVRPFRDDGSH